MMLFLPRYFRSLFSFSPSAHVFLLVQVGPLRGYCLIWSDYRGYYLLQVCFWSDIIVVSSDFVHTQFSLCVSLVPKYLAIFKLTFSIFCLNKHVRLQTAFLGQTEVNFSLGGWGGGGGKGSSKVALNPPYCFLCFFGCCLSCFRVSFFLFVFFGFAFMKRNNI